MCVCEREKERDREREGGKESFRKKMGMDTVRTKKEGEFKINEDTSLSHTVCNTLSCLHVFVRIVFINAMCPR